MMMMSTKKMVSVQPGCAGSKTNCASRFNAAKRLALLTDMHRRLWDVVPYLPLGQFIQPFLWRSNISAVLRSNVLAFWNISKA